MIYAKRFAEFGKYGLSSICLRSFMILKSLFDIGSCSTSIFNRINTFK